ncbi:ABC transporter permease [Novosphingobium beihaiensis]|uniref:ABC transporter permease n=1 Tax=Novosphingobium beihaiensis TaxID=2930389 RepID=A0ABT0BVK4_9SPHN|nr:ABC transporter permease [Novosphingobium beihaiensis]MCJ2189062.1 ABC transporter permease [Novosphingobium beihaiensis]
MNRFALLTLYRSLTRHRLYALLNIGGLALGLAVFLVLGLYVRFETSYEKWLPHHQQIYLVQTDWHMENSPFNGAYPNTMGGLLDELKQDFPSLTGTRIEPVPFTVIRNGIGVSEDGARVDSDFSKVFDLQMVQGSLASALAAPANVLIDETVAQKYFGATNPVGQTMTLRVNGEQGSYRVAGVFKTLPKATDLVFSILVPLPPHANEDNWHHWGSTSLYTYLRFATPAAAHTFEAKLDDFADRHGKADIGEHASKTLQLRLLPIARRHLTPAGMQAASAKQTVVTLGIVGTLALLIAIVNYINLATARAGLRAREVAMRKVLGASRAVLVRQFIGEAILMAAIAGLISLAMAELGLPLVNAAGGLSLAIPYSLAVPALAVLVVLVGIGAGFYPAVLLSRFPAASVLSSSRAPGGGQAGSRAREILVIFQFALAIAFVIGTLVLGAQIAHVRNADLGFKRDGLIIVRSLAETESQRGKLMTAFEKLPMIRSVTLGGSNAGGSGNNNADNVPLPGQPGPGPSLRWISVGKAFFSTYGAHLIAGRVFDDEHGSDDSTHRGRNDTRNIVINRQAVAVLGFASPQAAVGQIVGKGNPRKIIGVIDDMRFFSPRVPMDATYYLYSPRTQGFAVATLRYSGDLRTAMAAVKRVWQQIAPEIPFDAASADQRLDELYKADDNAAHLFTIGAVLAVLIGCVGLWGLASFNTARRIKEIGIRKTLGASSFDVVKLLVRQFLRPVLIANLFAWPLAWLALRRWLAGFDDAITLSPLYFLAATMLALLIAVLTVITQSLRAARTAPAWALRHE